MAPPEKRVTAVWQNRSMVFSGETAGKPGILIDGETGEGPSPMDALLIALATCSGSDVVHVMAKKRLVMNEFSVAVHGVRREEHPRRYVEINMVYSVVAPGATEAAVRQAIDLSLEKYCSVTHSLNPDIPIRYELRLQA